MAQYEGTTAGRCRRARMVVTNGALAFNGMQYGRIVDIGPSQLRGLRLFLPINHAAQGAVQWPISPGSASLRNDEELRS